MKADDIERGAVLLRKWRDLHQQQSYIWSASRAAYVIAHLDNTPLMDNCGPALLEVMKEGVAAAIRRIHEEMVVFGIEPPFPGEKP